MQNCMKLFSTATKLFVWRLKSKNTKSTVIPLLARGVQRVKSVSDHKYLRIVLDIELSNDKDIQIQLRYQKLVFPDVRTHWKMYFFFLSIRPCMHHNYTVISGGHTSTGCGWLITLVAGHCTACRGERVLAVIRCNVTLGLIAVIPNLFRLASPYKRKA